MGEPKKLRKQRKVSKKPMNQLHSERSLLSRYGIKRKKILHRVRHYLGKIHDEAKHVLSTANEGRKKLFNQKLINKGLMTVKQKTSDASCEMHANSYAFFYVAAASPR